MNKDVFEKAKALGQSIVESEEFKEVQRREDEIIKDASAQALLKRYHELQNLHKEKTKNGDSLSDEEKAELQQVQMKVMENKTIKSFSEAQEKFQHMMNQVMKVIRDAGSERLKE